MDAKIELWLYLCFTAFGPTNLFLCRPMVFLGAPPVTAHVNSGPLFPWSHDLCISRVGCTKHFVTKEIGVCVLTLGKLVSLTILFFSVPD